MVIDATLIKINEPTCSAHKFLFPAFLTNDSELRNYIIIDRSCFTVYG